MERTLRLSASTWNLVLLAGLAATLFPTMYGTHPGEGVRHWLAAAIAAAAGLSLVVAASRDLGRIDALRAIVGAASAGAATVHFAVISEHVEEWWLFGVFFAVAGLAQALWAVLVVARSPRVVYWLGALGNALVIGLWLVSRTAGLPIGPEAGEAEALQAADVIATAFEGAVVAGSLLLLAAPNRLALRRGPLAALVVATAIVTTVALASVTAAHSHDGGEHHPPAQHHG